ncbi:MAG: response regulator [Phycisphaerae bacterium]|nr:response regulator [Phycisphaerae bacterium]
MKEKHDSTQKAEDLRRDAEQALRSTRQDVAAMPAEEVQRLVYELQVHQVELEMQNQQLRATQQELEASRDAYAELYDFAPVGYVTLDAGGVILEANLTAARMLGLERKDLISRKLSHFVDPSDQDTLHRHRHDAFSTETRQACTVQMVASDGATCHVRLKSIGIHGEKESAYRCRMALIDISELVRAEEERRLLEAQFQHAQRLERLGILAGGIAHDFNNLLTGILGNASLALTDLEEGSPIRDGIRQIETSALRAAELTSQMLAYSGRGAFVVAPVDLSKLIREMAELLRSSIPKKVAVRQKLAGDLPCVEADIAQIRQVVMNLIINASEAIGDAEGVITVSTGVTDADRQSLADAHVGHDLPQGRYVYLEVADTGHGMDAATRSRMFDPFFTTKFTGRGLGLAATLGIIRGHRAAITVHSEPGKGTTFRALFPCSDRTPENVSGSGRGTQAEEFRGGTILVVDDEQAVRRLAAKALERAGFTVMTACDGREAVEIFRRHADEIAAVLLDRTMPATDGIQAFEEIRRIKPDARVVLSSGYTVQEAGEGLADSGLSGFIQKPYQPGLLIEKMREAVEGLQ